MSRLVDDCEIPHAGCKEIIERIAKRVKDGVGHSLQKTTSLF